MRLPLSVVITFFGASTFATAEQAGKCFALEDSMVQVLDAEQYYDLSEKLGDCGEAGQNHAAILMANAKRIETETHVASKSNSSGSGAKEASCITTCCSGTMPQTRIS
jgi:hypothetical protein